MKRSIGFLKTTAIGGLIFLLPVIVIGTLVGKLVQIGLIVIQAVSGWMPDNSFLGWAALVVSAVSAVLLMCFAAGLIARRSLGRRLSEKVESTLLMLFPRYTIIKAQMAGSVGQDEIKAQLKPVVARLEGHSRIGFQVDGTDEGLVAVYLPGAPDPWIGSVVYVDADRVQPLAVEFAEVLGTFERLGRGSCTVATAKDA